MKNIAVFILVSLITNYSFSQKGFFDARHSISLSANGNIPLLSGSFSNPSFVARGSEMVEKKDLLDYGFKFNYQVATSRNFSIGIIAGYLNFQVTSEKTFGKNYQRVSTTEIDSFSLRTQDVGFHKFLIMPTAEFYYKKGLSPMGLYHTLGLGLSLANIQKGHYAFSVSKAPINETEEVEYSEVDYFNFQEDWKSIRFIEIMFGVGMKLPITKKIGFNFAINYNINIAMKPSNIDINSIHTEMFNYGNIYYNARREMLGTMTLNTGLIFLL